MPERYDRSVCANELLLRNTIAQRIRQGWEVAPAFHLPATVDGNERIGKQTDDTTPPVGSSQPLTAKESEETQVSPRTDESPQVSTQEIGTEPVPM